MRPKYFSVQCDRVASYALQLLNVENDPELCAVLEHAKQKGTPPLQVVPSDGRTLEVLARSLFPKKILEIGTLCGYSSVLLARSLVENGKLYTCERSKHHATTAQQIFDQLGLQSKIEILFGDAMESLKKFSSCDMFDLIFIDADKINYPCYFDWAVTHLRKGGLLIADNVFVFDHIADEPLPEGSLGDMVKAMRQFNLKCVTDSRVLTSILPTGEGLSVSVRL